MIKMYDYEQEWFIYKTYKDMDSIGVDLEYLQTAYSLIPGHNILYLNSEPQMKKTIRQYVINNHQIFQDMESDYEIGMDYTYYKPGDETEIVWVYDKQEEIQEEKINIEITDEDRKAMDEWNNFMEKQYPTKPPKTKTKTKTLSKKTEPKTKKTNFIRKNPKK